VAALAGARDICAERLSEDAELRKYLREAYLNLATVEVKKRSEHADKVTKFDMYADFQEAIAKIPSHRYLAIRRGENESILYATLVLDFDPHLPFVRSRIPVRPGSVWAEELGKVTDDALKRLLGPAVSGDVRVELKLRSDKEAIDVFARNMQELLMSPPLGTKTVLGIDPGQRTGCKCVVVDETGKLIEHENIYLVQGDGAQAKGREILRRMCRTHNVRAIAVGNGTHGRETEAFVRELLASEGLDAFCVSVNESGASIYSASDTARDEFPDLDLTVRGSISIARRLQDPLAELVKIDPKSIGVGQYQHDVSQPALGRKLDEVIESCVNSVGVELNTASAPLLSRVAGIGPTLAKRIVSHRNQHGSFKSRRALLEVAGMGPRTFEQAAGFLRVAGGEHPLDASAVHPERYTLVEKMAADVGVPVANLVGNSELVRRLDPTRYRGGDVGDFTLSDILTELDKPGRDPRKSFEPPKFREDVRTMEDLQVGMELEGVVTNITAFGAFVDVGVHQDGLVHISQLADKFVKDPHEVVAVGDKIKVKVLEIDLERHRIALTARRDTAVTKSAQPSTTAGKPNPNPRANPENRGRGTAGPNRSPQSGQRPAPEKFSHNPFAKVFGKG
jgi:protein Tex